MKTRIATLAILFGLFISATAFSAEPVHFHILNLPLKKNFREM